MTAQRQNVFIARCQQVLKNHWDIVQNRDISQDFEPDISETIRHLLRSQTKSYRYVLPTQLLAKITNPQLDSRCIQAGRQAGEGNFDARSINEKVVIPFEREQNKPLGGSPQPYVNNPLRVPEISETYRDAQKDKEGWDLLCEIMEIIEDRQDHSFTERVFNQVLLEIRRIQQEITIDFPIPQRISLEATLGVLEAFLDPRTGGGRLQAISVAIFKTMQGLWGIYDEVNSASVTAADAPGRRAADIECKKHGETILAVEVKDRTVTMELLEDKITSLRLAQVRELLFLIRANQLVDNHDVIEMANREFTSGLNIYLFEASAFYKSILSIMAEEGRRLFLSHVGEVLIELQLDYRDRREWAGLLSNI